MTPEEKIAVLGIELPPPPKPLGSYVPFVRTGNLLFISGMLPLKGGSIQYSGRVGEGVDVANANGAARMAAINCLSVVRAALGSLNEVKRCVKVEGFVSSSEGFFDQPKVINGASDLLFEVFGEGGLHTRVAVGVNNLPLNSPVEISFIFEVG